MPATHEHPNAHIAAYDAQAPELCARYDAVDMTPARTIVLDWLNDIAPGTTALEVGAGSGRDARWLTSLGYAVTALEPSSGMRAIGQAHPDNGSINWIDGKLPDLFAYTAPQYDLVLCWAVWQHIAPKDRDHAFEMLLGATKPDGDLIIMVRIGEAPADRPMYPVEPDEIVNQCRRLGLPELRSAALPDIIGRPGCTWTAFHIKMV